MLLLLDVLADVPVLLGNLTLSWGYASLSGLHVAVDLDGVLSAALVRVNPVLTWRTMSLQRKTSEQSKLQHAICLPGRLSNLATALMLS